MICRLKPLFLAGCHQESFLPIEGLPPMPWVMAPSYTSKTSNRS